jgi:hypothetical protein
LEIGGLKVEASKSQEKIVLEDVKLYTSFVMIGKFKNRPTESIQWFINKKYWKS